MSDCENCAVLRLTIEHLREKLAESEAKVDAVRKYCETEGTKVGLDLKGDT